MTPAPEGLVVVDKPGGVTSFDMVHAVGRALKTRRIGHTGTLDPFATGLLLLLVGRGTRLIPYVNDEPKVYRATISFGAETDTDDLTGTIARDAEAPDWTKLAPALEQLTGVIQQVPPQYSAKKIEGRRAYDLARSGQEVALPAVTVQVHHWELLDRSATTLEVRVACGRGTYIRSLARDLGRLLQSAAHLTALRRERAGAFDLDSANDLASVREQRIVVRPLRDAVAHLPSVSLSPDDFVHVQHGRAIAATSSDRLAALISPSGALVAIAARQSEAWHPKVVLDAA